MPPREKGTPTRTLRLYTQRLSTGSLKKELPHAFGRVSEGSMVRNGACLWCYIIIVMFTSPHKSFAAIRSSAEPAGGHPGHLRRLSWQVSVL